MTVTVLETAKGPIALRPEREDDASFLYELFRSHTLPGFASMPVDEAMKESLVRMQFRAQTGSYRAGFPRGLFAVLEQDGVPIGRLVWDEKDGVAYIVDLALMPGSRGGGIGTAFMTALLAWAGERCAMVWSLVLHTNVASLRMCERVGMVHDGDEGVNARMVWRRGAS